ncbi:type II toxin-antitoxin system Phd/YefM family antitoxin [Novosphingobium mangrovi (ex Huang et al. 2023)]|uniref:Antitoxin n=1 Tax=Novosphingobium mangrovi (ex Huang et al. 2023) TaxID=2976432 RepID=A0ABT2I471_9SPHN|nr:type II toxin-antitoxin system Phd/YefM family antitoxin [Novosphingobium mangrovi (ex Huang et al. 2023)]MCT2399601.1 type II toxin-antitoxin system Phd/YefM family antitoxin [Novosphingobium mangrovi (ex Huang et al. 2023)]
MNVETHSDVWTVAEAKARLSEVIERARREPQEITRHGKSAVVMVDAALWERIKRREHRGSFADFLRTSPLRGSGLEIDRLEGGIREVDL